MHQEDEPYSSPIAQPAHFAIELMAKEASLADVMAAMRAEKEAAEKALELREGLSFLNVGSGTGYLSALAAQMLGPHACHHAVELKQGLVDHSMRKARRKPAQDSSVAMPTHPCTNPGPYYPALTPHPNPCRTAGASRPLFYQGAPRRAA